MISRQRKIFLTRVHNNVSKVDIDLKNLLSADE